MPRVTDLLRARLLADAGVIEGPRVPDLPGLREIRWVPEFERLMRNRLMMGAFRYECEDLRESPVALFDNLPSIRHHLDAYEATGDLEHLVDAANLCMLEFRLSRHPSRHMGRGGDNGHHTERIDG